MPRLFVICGHGAGDPGACSGGYGEAERVRALASRMQALGGSEVQVGDTNVNWYASNWIGAGKCPSGVPVVELHMDSAAASAKGGHVIIKAGIGGADKYDAALASFISGMFPGRSKTVVERSDLANPNRAAAKGVNYRLLECCFISNSEDLRKFNAQMDDLARGILAAFGIGSASAPAPSAPSAPAAGNGASAGLDLGDTSWWGKKFTTEMQKQLGCATVDGVVSRQPTSNKKYLANADTSSWQFTGNCSGGSAMVKALQSKVGAGVDGWSGKETVTKLQQWLQGKGYNVGSSGYDGSLGPATCQAVGKALQDGAFK